MKRPTWRGLLGWALSGGLVYFIGRRLAELWPQIISRSWTLHALPFTLSILMLATAFLLVALAWVTLVRGMGERLSLVASLRIYFLVSLGRYLPGKVWTIMGASAMARQEQCSGLHLGTAMVYLGFMTLQVGSGLSLVGLILFPWGQALELPPYFLWLLAAAVTGLAFLPSLGSRLIAWALRLLRREVTPVRVPISTVAIVLALILVHWFVEALAYQLLIRSMYELPWQSYPELLFSTAFSTVLGFLAFFVPAGLGVRDGALLVAFTQFMPQAIAGVMSVAIRIWYTVVDVAVVLAAASLLSWLRRRHGKAGPPVPESSAEETACVE